MSLFGTLIKQAAKASDGLFDDVAVQAKHVDEVFDEEAWLRENPRPPGNSRDPAVKAWAERLRRARRTPKEVEENKRKRKKFYDENRDRILRGKRDDYEKDPEKYKGRVKRYTEENPEKVKARRAAQRERDREILRLRSRKWRSDNPEKAREVSARNFANRKKRVPSWESATDREDITEIYNTRTLISEITGIPHHVDHVIPMQGRKVSGLHTPDNLLIVPGSDNVRKYNSFSPGDSPPIGGVEAARSLLEEVLKGMQ